MVVVVDQYGRSPPGMAGCRALVVEPQATNRRLLCDILAMLNVGNVACCDGRDLDRALEEGRWHVLFLDWSRQFDAIEWLRNLRQPSHHLAFQPVVVISGFSGSDQVAEARDAGATEYILKPFTLDVVRSRLRSVIDHPRPFIQTEDFFGPDRRRRVMATHGPDRRAAHGLAPQRPGQETTAPRSKFALTERRGQHR